MMIIFPKGKAGIKAFPDFVYPKEVVRRSVMRGGCVRMGIACLAGMGLLSLLGLVSTASAQTQTTLVDDENAGGTVQRTFTSVVAEDVDNLGRAMLGYAKLGYHGIATRLDSLATYGEMLSVMPEDSIAVYYPAFENKIACLYGVIDSREPRRDVAFFPPEATIATLPLWSQPQE